VHGLASLERDNLHSQRRPRGSPSRGRSINIFSGRPLTWFDQVVWCDANHVFPSVRVFNSYFFASRNSGTSLSHEMLCHAVDETTRIIFRIATMRSMSPKVRYASA